MDITDANKQIKVDTNMQKIHTGNETNRTNKHTLDRQDKQTQTCGHDKQMQSDIHDKQTQLDKSEKDIMAQIGQVDINMQKLTNNCK